MQFTLTPHHATYFAYDLTPQAGPGIDPALFDAAVHLNPHQIEASLIALQSPLSHGVIPADEAGLRTPIEPGFALSQLSAHRRRRLKAERQERHQRQRRYARSTTATIEKCDQLIDSLERRFAQKIET